MILHILKVVSTAITVIGSSRGTEHCVTTQRSLKGDGNTLPRRLRRVTLQTADQQKFAQAEACPCRLLIRIKTAKKSRCWEKNWLGTISAMFTLSPKRAACYYSEIYRIFEKNCHPQTHGARARIIFSNLEKFMWRWSGSMAKMSRSDSHRSDDMQHIWSRKSREISG